MQETSTCSHDELEARLLSASAESGASEAHGLMCGIICAGGKATPDTWLGPLLGEGNTSSSAAWGVSELLEELQAEILAQLNDDAFSFALLLPDDQASLLARTKALSSWCAGFLYGLALGGIREDADYPGDSREVIKDFYEISNAGFIADPTDDDNEEAYMEIVEYVRMSVLLLYEDMQSAPAPTRLQ
ncbi:MAG: YecA family protein [Gammaproteobacteria bacterium]